MNYNEAPNTEKPQKFSHISFELMIHNGGTHRRNESEFLDSCNNFTFGLFDPGNRLGLKKGNVCIINDFKT